MMDTNNWRPAPSGGEAVLDGGDWRSQLSPDSRTRIVNKIMDTLGRHLPFSGPEGFNEFRKIAVRFEEYIYSTATNQLDYLRRISIKMLAMESKSHVNAAARPANPGGNASSPPDQGMQQDQIQQMPIIVQQPNVQQIQLMSQQNNMMRDMEQQQQPKMMMEQQNYNLQNLEQQQQQQHQFMSQTNNLSYLHAQLQLAPHNNVFSGLHQQQQPLMQNQPGQLPFQLSQFMQKQRLLQQQQHQHQHQQAKQQFPTLYAHQQNLKQQEEQLLQTQQQFQLPPLMQKQLLLQQQQQQLLHQQAKQQQLQNHQMNQGNHHVLEEQIREINQRLMDTNICDKDSGYAVNVNSMALSPNLKKSQYDSVQLMSPVQPLSILLDKLPVEVSNEYEDLLAKKGRRTRFSKALRSQSQMSLKEIIANMVQRLGCIGIATLFILFLINYYVIKFSSLLL